MFILKNKIFSGIALKHLLLVTALWVQKLKKLENKLLLPKVKYLGILYKNVITSEWHWQSAQRPVRPKDEEENKNAIEIIPVIFTHFVTREISSWNL